MLRGSKDMGLRIKCHSSPEEAFKCMAKHLVRDLGYTQIGPREFSPADHGPVRVLTKKSRFGGVLKAGKGGETGTSKRVMPKQHTGGMIASI